MTEQAMSRRLTVQEAAEVLGTSVDAVRMRARRGSLDSEKEPDGRVYVWVDGGSSQTKPRLDGESTTLISAKDETIAVLREQLEAEREARRRADTIIAQLTQANAALVSRVPELEAGGADRGPGGVENTPEDAGRGALPEEREKATERPWWSRVFGR